MNRHYVRAENGDEAVVDLNGVGLFIQVGPTGEYFDVHKVRVTHNDKREPVKLVVEESDLLAVRWEGDLKALAGARAIRLFRDRQPVEVPAAAPGVPPTPPPPAAPSSGPGVGRA